MLGGFGAWHLFITEPLIIPWVTLGAGLLFACVFGSLSLKPQWLNYYGGVLGGVWLGVILLVYLGQTLILHCLWVLLSGILIGLYLNCSHRSTGLKVGLGDDDRRLWQRLCHSFTISIAGWFVLTTVPWFGLAGLRHGLVLVLTIAGILEYHGWQIRISEQTLHLNFYGIWGTQAHYLIPLRQFNRLETVAMTEAQDIQWRQLLGYAHEVTFPLALELSQEDEQTMREAGSLARHSSTRDSLELVHILLPQGAGIMAGFALVLLGSILLWVWPADLPIDLMGLLLLSISLTSAYSARLVLSLVSPAHLYPEALARTRLLLPWEWGGLLAMAVFFLAYNNHLPELAGLGLGWFTLALGITLLSLVRRTPIGTKS